MQTPKISKAQLLADNAELRRAVALRDEYMLHALKGEVHFISKGTTRLGYCGATRAHGGVVCEFICENNRAVMVAGFYYFEPRRDYVRAYPVLGNDQERQDWRTCYERVASEISKEQAEFYAPKVAEACGV